jgi:ParB-like chromosome segregation protein Spo0J
MSTKNKTPETPFIEWLDIKSLTVEDGYNVRTAAELKSNAAKLAKMMEATGGFDVTHPIQYVERDGKKFTRSHTRLAAAIINGYKKVPCVKASRDKISDQLHLVSGNAANPLNQIQQGIVFARLRDGEKAEDCKAGEEVRAPMTPKEISKAIGKSIQHVNNCLAIFDAPDDIKPFLMEGKISANAFTLASSGVTSKRKVLEILRATIANAKEDGKETATEKHVRAVKSQFVEPKPLKAAKTTASKSGDAASKSPASASKDENKGDAADDPNETIGDLPFSSVTENTPATTPVGELLPATTETKPVATKSERKKIGVEIRRALEEWCAVSLFAPTEKELDHGTDLMMAVLLPF